MEIRVIKRNTTKKAEISIPIAKPEKDVAGVVRKWIADTQKNDETENRPTFEKLLGPHSRTAKLV